VTPAWRVLRLEEPAGEFHARPLPEPVRREVWCCAATGPALVLGSAQRDTVVDRAACAAVGVDVVRRRSGGGAVLVEPALLLWVDVLLPAGDPLWGPDVGRAFLWLGDTWAAALADQGVTTAVHRGALQRSRWSDLVCFAGLGPGELTDAAGAKVVGISQRRTRAGARFQCAVLLQPWDPRPLLALLALAPGEREAAIADLAPAPAGASGDGALDGAALLAAFVAHLP
jgi:lipoate-protein ligase A